MPQRTNLFQRMVASFKEVTAPGCRVLESALVPEKHGDDEREVDVLIERRVADHPIRIQVECTDRSRKAGKPWIETQIAKFQALETDLLVLVSSSGFTDSVEQYVADRPERVDLVSLEGLQDAATTEIAGRLKRLFLGLLDVVSGICVSEEVRDVRPDDSVPRDARIVSADGETDVTAGRLADAILDKPTLLAAILKPPREEATRWGHTIALVPKPGVRVHLPDGSVLEPAHMGLVVLLYRRWFQVPLRHGTVEGKAVSFGEARDKMGDVTVTVLEEDGAPPRGLMVLGDDPSSPRRYPIWQDPLEDLDPAPDEVIGELFSDRTPSFWPVG